MAYVRRGRQLLWPDQKLWRLQLNLRKRQGEDDRDRRQQREGDRTKIQSGRQKWWRSISPAEQTALTGHGVLLMIEDVPTLRQPTAD
jgi:hypothetical protein